MINSPESILNFFKLLNGTNINWILVRNSDNEIPLKHKKYKDIDLLIHEDSKERMRELFLLNRIVKIIHPLNGAIRLYGLEPFEMYITPEKLLIDIAFQLSVKSIGDGQWLPLDQKIQKSAFENFQTISMLGVPVKILSPENRAVEMITRAIFVKKTISSSKLNEISKLINKCEMSILRERLRLVFFKFTDKLLEHIDNENINMIEAYLKFRDY